MLILTEREYDRVFSKVTILERDGINQNKWLAMFMVLSVKLEDASEFSYLYSKTAYWQYVFTEK